jgi:deazaflavin-dependent oxidoreductase (nitroreductase family)
MRGLYRAPIWLYQHGMGCLLGGRFLLLRHIGRKSGLVRYAVVEIVRHDRESGGYLIASGFGEKSDWFQNLMQHPAITIQVRRREQPVHARRLVSEEGAAEMVAYARRNPRAARALSRLLGYPVDGSDASYQRVGAALPFVWLEPLKDLDGAAR